MKRAAVTGALIIALVVGGATVGLQAATTQARRDRTHFNAECARAFQESRDPEAVRRLYPGLPFAVRHLKDGSWVAVCAHTIHNEAPPLNEWDSAIVWDSRGVGYRSRHHFCGVEGMDADLRTLPDQSLNAFYKRAVPAFGLERLP